MSTFSDSFPFFMTHRGGLHGGAVGLLRLSQERHAKALHAAAVRAEADKLAMAETLAKLNLRTGHDRRDPESAPRFGSMADTMNFHDRRVSERRARFAESAPAPMYAPFAG